MPDGFEQQVKPADLRNLLEFLTTRGKYFPLDLAKVATVVSTKGMFNSETSPLERLVFPDWKPKTVDGVPFYLVDPEGDRRATRYCFTVPMARFRRGCPSRSCSPAGHPPRRFTCSAEWEGGPLPMATREPSR